MSKTTTRAGMLVIVCSFSSSCVPVTVGAPEQIRLLTIEATHTDAPRRQIVCHFNGRFDAAKLRSVLNSELTKREGDSGSVEMAIQFLDSNNNTWSIVVTSELVPTKRRWYTASQHLVADETVIHAGGIVESRYDKKAEFVADIVNYFEEYVDETPGTYP